MDCSKCENQVICEAQNKLDMARVNDIRLLVERLDYKEALDNIGKYKEMLIRRNERIAGRCWNE